MLKLAGLALAGLFAGLIISQVFLSPGASSLSVLEAPGANEEVDEIKKLSADVRQQLGEFEQRLDEMVAEIASLRSSSIRAGLDADDEGATGGADSASAATSVGARPTGLTEAELRSLSQAELQMLADASPRNAMVRAEVVRREWLEKWRNEPPPAQPIMLGPDFAWMTEYPDPRHELLQREPYDAYWSATTEGQIATFLAEHPEITQKYGQPTVHCRTSGCEVAFVAYGIDETDGFDLMRDERLNAVSGEPWAQQFPDPASSARFGVRRAGNTTTIVWYLTKQPILEYMEEATSP